MNKQVLKGVILAGGTGTRLRPVTLTQNKHLLGILNEPMILYPIRTLKEMGVYDVLLITGGDHIGGFAEFLGDGSEYGIRLTYKVQKNAGGIAEALGLARDFYSGTDDKVITILGDNIFGHGISDTVMEKGDEFLYESRNNALLFLKEVKDPERFGVAKFVDGKVVSIEEKPKHPKSNLIVTGLYIYPPDVFDVIAQLKYSARGEKEISEVNNYYLKEHRCSILETKNFWSDAGTPQSLYEATKWAAGNIHKLDT